MAMQESPAQSPEAGEEAEEGAAGAARAEADSEPAPAIQQIEAISSGTERSYLHHFYISVFHYFLIYKKKNRNKKLWFETQIVVLALIGFNFLGAS